ncbi:MAG: glycosyltransferase family 2 protein [Planctomycetes bacterium]|nr:glycosyltransferase family 2 protein [Planctomycetota bacterium]
MFSYLESIPDAGAVGCKLLNADLTLQTNSIMPFPTILNQALDVEYLKLSLPWLNLWGIKPLFNNDSAYEEVEVISGACIMVKRKVFEDIKMFSPDYFMYSEELDLCYKIKKAGFKAYYTGEAAIIHHGGRSVDKTQIKYFPILMMQDSLLKFLKKNRGTLYGTVYRLMTAVVAVSRLILITGFMPVGFFVFDRTALYYSYNKWRKILRWAICLDSVQMPKRDYVKNPIGKC